MDHLKGNDPLSFWKRPEGKTGMFFLVILIAALSTGMYMLLPFLIVLMQNILYAAILALALAALLFAIFDKRIRALVGNMYKSAMRFITGIFIELDPIGIMKNYLDTLVGKREDLNNQIAKVSGVRNQLAKNIQTNQKSVEKSMQHASIARKKNKDKQVEIHTRSAGRLEEVNQRMVPLKKRLDNLIEILAKVDSAVGLSIDDLKEEIRVTEMEFKSMRAASKAMKQAAGALSSTGVDFEFFERAQEYVEQDVAEKVGQIDNYLRISSNIMESLDFKDEVALDKGLAMLDQWEQNGALKLGNETVSAPSNSNQAGETVSNPGKIKNVFDRYRKEFHVGE